MSDNLGLIVMDNIKEIGIKVEKEINKLRDNSSNYIIPIEISRFSNGEGKVKILKTVRNKDIYILCDMGNYDITYNMFGFVNHCSPDDHFEDLKRVILAMCGHAKKITIIMPFLYEARQHRKKSRESLDCAYALQELMNMGVSEIVTFDVHDPNICNAIPLLAYDNFYVTNNILEKLVKDNSDILNNSLVISPDFGAMERARYFAEMLRSDVGIFYKRRDLSKVVNGKNPVIEHSYLGSDVKDKNIIVVDDMIASGNSMIEFAAELKNRGAKKIFIVSTFSLFTEGLDNFTKAYNDGIIDKIYTTNLTYIRNEYLKNKWICVVDCSSKIATIIDYLNMGKSIGSIIDDKDEFYKRIENIANHK